MEGHICVADRTGSMNHLETQLLAILQEHQGKDQAITVDELQQLIPISTRKIRAIIARLVTEYRVPVASSTQLPYGFYLITNEAEARHCLHQYWSRVKEVSRRARRLNAAVKERFGIDVQQEFPFDEPPAR